MRSCVRPLHATCVAVLQSSHKHMCACLQNLSEVVSGVLANMDLFGNWSDVFAMCGRNAHPTMVIWGACDEVLNWLAYDPIRGAFSSETKAPRPKSPPPPVEPVLVLPSLECTFQPCGAACSPQPSEMSLQTSASLRASKARPSSARS